MAKKKASKKKTATVKKTQTKTALSVLILLCLATLALGVTYFFPDLNTNLSPAANVTFRPATHLKNATPSANPAVKSSSTQLPLPAPIGRSVRVPILTYHYIGNNPNPADKARDSLEVTPDKFEEQMKYLSSNGYSTINFDTLYATLKGSASLPSKPVILTFDDGYIDFYVNAFPILRRYNLRAVSFIPTGLMNQGYYMSWAQIKEINSSGLVSFQAHSVTHPNLTILPADKLKNEVFTSKLVLESQLGKPVNTFAYPYGASDSRVWNIVKSAGFVGAVGTWGGVVETEGTIFDMPRMKVGNYDVKTFASRL